LFDGQDFRMLQAVVGVARRADDCAFRIHNNGSHTWVG
jgi:hypothetical protein